MFLDVPCVTCSDEKYVLWQMEDKMNMLKKLNNNCVIFILFILKMLIEYKTMNSLHRNCCLKLRNAIS